MADASEPLIRETTSTCPYCYNEIEARIVEKNGKIYMQKSCIEHGDFELLISRHPWYYKGLTEYYFGIMPERLEQRRFYIYLSNKCNMNCPICLLEPNQQKVPDISLTKFRDVIRNNKQSRFYLYGAEPTLRPDILDWIKLLKQSGNLVNMHTNGIKLVDYSFLKELHNNGLDYVSLQFDGFKDGIYTALRGQKLLKMKLQVLDNLCKLNIPTGLNVTIAKGINEDQIGPILDYAVKHNFIKDVSFATLSLLGSTCNNFSADSLLMPDELIDIVEEQTKGKISRQSFYLFQKLYYAFLSSFRVRRCYNFQHLAIVRGGDGGYSTFDQLLDLRDFEKKLDVYKRMIKHNKWSASLYLGVQIVLNLLRGNFFRKISCLPLNMFIPGQLRSPRIPNRIFLVSFGTVCDFVKYDSRISRYCGQGICLERDGGIVLTDNISDLSMFKNKVSK